MSHTDLKGSDLASSLTSLSFRWFWKGKPKNAGQMEDCCAIRPVGIHKYKQSILIEQLDKQFYGPADGKDLKRLNARTRRYADKVRRAMGISK